MSPCSALKNGISAVAVVDAFAGNCLAFLAKVPLVRPLDSGSAPASHCDDGCCSVVSGPFGGALAGIVQSTLD